MERCKETWRKVHRPKARARNACYHKPRHLIEAHRQTISLIVTFSSDSRAKLLNASASARLERSSNSQKSPKHRLKNGWVYRVRSMT